MTFAIAIGCVLAPAPALAVYTNGKLQVIHLDAGQGDAAAIITPGGQVVMIDDGTNFTEGTSPPSCARVLSELQALGVTHVDLHFASHYHADHIGCITSLTGVTIDQGWDRGQSYSSTTFTNYMNFLGPNRHTLAKGQVFTLDSLSAHPVTIKCVALAGDGISTSDENSKCLVLKVSYGEFDEVFGGDLTGYPSGTSSSSTNIETKVGPQVGKVEVYKIHHHGSAYTSYDDWLNATTPKIGIISCGTGNTYGHPTASALSRLHAHQVRTYWTELGKGATPDPAWDKVANNQIRINAVWQPGGVDSIIAPGIADTLTNSGAPAIMWAIQASAGANGSIGPSGTLTVAAGASQSFTFTADPCYHIADVVADGGSVGTVGTYTFTNVTTNHTIAASFAANPYALAVTTIGSGSVVRSPDQPEYTCGATVQLTATANSGWAFAGWSGDTTGTANPLTLTLANDKNVIATFMDVEAPLVQVTSPIGGEWWTEGAAQPIQWMAGDNVAVDSVDVDYSLTGADGPWVAAAHGLANSGSYLWTVPMQLTDSALVRVIAYDQARNAGSATSDTLFHIGNATLSVGSPAAATLMLAQPEPNPSSAATRLQFSLPQAGPARLEIIDLSGRRVWAQSGSFAAGPQSWRWEGSTMSGARAGAGLYFVRLTTPWGDRVQRLVLLR